MALPLAQLEGKYEILAKIKEGGMGAIYKVRHALLDEIRVVKVMKPALEQDEELNQRFIREARTAIKLRHPNIAQLYDFSMDESGTGFIVMEFIEGLTLEEILKRGGPPPIQLVVEIAKQSLRSLEYLHRRGFIHRDISPDNLMLTHDVDQQPLVKLIDLGIAKVLGGDAGMTKTGTFLGKIRYASPEHFQDGSGSSKVDFRSDLYSFGLVLYELMTGHFPISGTDLSSLIAGHLFRPVMSFEESDPEGRVPEQMRAIVTKAMAKKVKERIQTAQDFLDLLDEFQTTLPPADLSQQLDEVLKLRIEPQLGQNRAPGTTQKELDKEFPPEQSSATMLRGSTTSVRQILDQAQQFFENNDLPEARRLITEALEFDPGNADARELLRSVEERGRQVEREGQITQLEADIRDLVEKERLGEAVAELEANLTRLGEDPRFDSLRQEINQAMALRKRRQQVYELLDQAQQLYQQKNLSAALKVLHQALEIDPSHESARALESSIEKAVTDQRLNQQLGAVEKQVEKALKNHDLKAAERGLNRARQVLGSLPQLDTLELKIEAARDELRREQVHALLEESRQLTASTRLEDARDRAKAALEIDPQHAEARRTLQQVEALIEARDKERQREEALRQALAQIEQLIAAEKLAEADSALFRADKQFGEDSRLKAVRGKLDQRHLEQKQRNIKELLAEAARTSSQGQHDEALDLLRRVLILDAEHAEAKAEIERLEAAKRLKSAVQNIRASIAKKQWPQARAQLEAALGRLGPQGLEEVQKEIEHGEQEERDGKAEALLAQAQAHLDAGRAEEALRSVDAAAALEPSQSETLEALRHKAASGLEEKQQRTLEVERIGKLIDAGQLQQAEADLVKALKKFGRHAELEVLRERMDQLSGQIKKVLQHRQRIDEHAGKNDFTRARRELDGARALAPLPAFIQTELDQLNDELERRENEWREAEAIARSTGSIEEHLSKGSLEEARRLLETAKERHGKLVFSGLEARLESEEKEHRAQLVHEALEEAAKARAAGDLGAAVTAFQRAHRADPDNRDVSQQLRQAETELEEQRRLDEQARELQEAVTQIEALRDRGKFKKALQELDQVALRLDVGSELQELRSALEEAIATAPGLPLGKIAAGVAGLVLVVALFVWAPWNRPPPVAATTLVINALPWGLVTGLADAEGIAIALPEDAYTPLRLSLEPGSYVLSLEGPGGASAAGLEVEVRHGEEQLLLHKFEAPSSEELLEGLGLGR